MVCINTQHDDAGLNNRYFYFCKTSVQKLGYFIHVNITG